MKKLFSDIGAFIVEHKIFTIVTAALLVAVIVGLSVFCTLFNPELYRDRYSEGILASANDVKSATTYKRVVIFGVDGAGGYFGEGNVPQFQRVFGGGAYTYEGISQYKTVSAHNWTSMMHGVMYQKHLVTNEIAATSHYINDKYPSFFKVYANNHPDATCASIVSWKPINYGIIEEGIKGMTKLSAADYVEKGANQKQKDEKVMELATKRIAEHDDAILFLHFDNVDHMGHTYGYGSKEYAESISTVDGYIGRIYDAYVQAGRADDTLFILVSDHGHRVTGGHGQNNSTERNVTFAVNGAKGNIIDGRMGKFVTQDLAAVVLYALGETQPDTWQARIPYGVFNTLPTTKTYVNK